MKKFRTVMCLLLVFAMIFTLAACGGGKSEGGSSTKKDTVTTYINGDIPTFDNYNHTLAIQSTIEFQIFNFPLSIDVNTGKEIFD
ncbi:MAG: hypothetical protein II689_04000, partial [Firmicutes bacterium]|nr:hypothetical protein [Bacillota bacterium]